MAGVVHCLTLPSPTRSPFTEDHFPTSTGRLKSFHLASNPFHLSIDDRTICIFCQPVLDKLRKSVIHSESAATKSTSSLLPLLSRLWLYSGHLTAGLNRNFLNPLSLFPRVPDTILIPADRFDTCQPYSSLSESQLATVCSFSRHQHQFVVYYARANRLEESQISV